jgi:hypothetical protein
MVAFTAPEPIKDGQEIEVAFDGDTARYRYIDPPSDWIEMVRERTSHAGLATLLADEQDSVS